MNKLLDMIKHNIRLLLTLFYAILFGSILLCSCNNEAHYVPKPRGYFRIDLPEKQYLFLDTIERYRFEYPSYARITNDVYAPQEKNWINVDFPEFKGTLHLSHKNVDGNLGTYLEDVHTMLIKHLQKANGMHDSLIVIPEKTIYGMMIEMDGKGVATPLQFYLTDSTNNFVRGALYFNFLPNNDSMQPVIDYIKDDINHIVKTFEWK
jgi:hypothetical protein